jgi:uncharacterized membrane protein
MIRDWLTGSTVAIAISTVFANLARASDSVLPLLAQIKVSETGGKTYAVEIAVVVILFGAALFVVCKTSRRT